MRIGITIEPSTLETTLERFRRAEADGFASAWISNIFGLDALTTLALAGQVTSRIELGSFVVPTYPRHPMALAQSALTASAAAPGRLALGIGLSHQVVIEGMFGLDYSKPIRHTREYLSVLMPLLQGETVAFSGKEYNVNGRIDIRGAQPPPVILAALGPQMLKLAGSLADGTATWMGGAKYLGGTAIPAIRAAAAEAGRPAPRIVSGIPIAVTNDVDAARTVAAQTFQNYGRLPSYRAVLDVQGADANPADIAIIGDEAEVERSVRQLAEIGVTDLNAATFALPNDPDVRTRTRDLLGHLALEAS